MQIFRHIAPLKAFLSERLAHRGSVGLVPTMGYLHRGHLALIDASQKQNALTVCSIYVNPSQFNNRDDFDQYPRSLDDDIAKLEIAHVDAVFCPDDVVMYDREPGIQIGFGNLALGMEGKYRPGHFNGVALAVAKLLNIVEPNHAYFGQKDWQQIVVVREMVRELKFNVDIKVVPTVREQTGLAMSSRNARLSPAGRDAAGVLYKALTKAGASLREGKTIEEVAGLVNSLVGASGVTTLEYFEVADSETLRPIKSVKEAASPMLFIAGYVEGVRLIDNLFL